jgi:non-lysosomal glucosylceramidase
MPCDDANQACGCNAGVDRRGFLKIAGVTALSAVTSNAQSTQHTDESSIGLIPIDKHLDPGWLRSLTDRGQRTVYRGDDLKKIGMPIGGACAGQLYLGGDGKLWRWGIFNQHRGTGDAHYAHPPDPDYPLDQGFALRVTAGGKSQVRTLDQKGFSDIRFTGEYPIGFVTYSDERCPVTVWLEAFSPFIPLDTENSALPATVLQYTLKNKSNERLEVELVGWLQNAVCLYSGNQHAGTLRMTLIPLEAGGDILLCSAEEKAPPAGARSLRDQSDFGTMALAMLGTDDGDMFALDLPQGDAQAAIFADGVLSQRSRPADKNGVSTRILSGGQTTQQGLTELFRGALGRKLSLHPAKEATVTFVIAWHFPNLPHPADAKMTVGNYYAKRFSDAASVVNHIAANFDRLVGDTRLWHKTWYDSTLPYWFLDRTFANMSILATSTCDRWRNGRFWCWEGVGCCIGTCTHVWHYAHAVARLFPELERSTREIQDLDTGFDEATGSIGMRGEFERLSATDGQTGTILRLYREHQMSADDQFLNRNWPRIKRAIEFVVRQDRNDDGIIEGDQPNTLDTSFFGPNAMIGSLYLASVRAAEEMAREVGDAALAERLRRIFETGTKRYVDLLWNGEYFIQRPDPGHPDALKTAEGCFIDQVFGQSWAWQVGLGRILPQDKTVSALKALWKYNFAPDIGPWREVYKPGRWYAMPGEAGLIMCTWPKGGYEKSRGKVNPGFAAYLNECMNGFEYQVAGHMIWEGLVEEGLAITRAIHDRYGASRRNPWNEVECGDHYARSMASYGVFLAACGFEHHGPSGYLAFAPRISPDNFRAAFTTAEGWGTFEQKRDAQGQTDTIRLRHGRLRLKRLHFDVSDAMKVGEATVSIAGESVAADRTVTGPVLQLSFPEPVIVTAGQALDVLVR